MSRNHTVRPYQEDERRWHCGVQNCLNEATHVCSYSYVTGYLGRISTVNMNRCADHAREFKKAHGAKGSLK